MRAFKQIVTVGRKKEILIKDVPYSPGSDVEVIILPSETNIFKYTNNLVKKKKIPRYSLKEIENIIHEHRDIK